MEKNLQIQKTSLWSLILICSIIFESLFRKKNKKRYFINQVRVSSKAALKHALESRLSVQTTQFKLSSTGAAKGCMQRG